MPEMSKSAVADGPYSGDIKTHIFKINIDSLAEPFTPDGRFANGYLTRTNLPEPSTRRAETPAGSTLPAHPPLYRHSQLQFGVHQSRPCIVEDLL